MLFIPGLARTLNQYFHTGMATSLFVALIVYTIVIGFMIYEKLRIKKPILRSPYLLILVLFIINHSFIIFGTKIQLWNDFLQQSLKPFYHSII